MQQTYESFYESKAKIIRAQKLLNELTSETEKYFESSQLVSTVESITETGEIQIVFKFELIPHEIRAIIGDIVHNIRSSLDIAACELARINNKSDKNVYFPFCDSEERLDETIKNKKFHRAGDKAISIIRELKPFTGGNTILRAIHDLDILDKHKLLIPIPVQLESPPIRIKDDNDMPITPEIMQGKGKSTLIFQRDEGDEILEVIPTLSEMISLVSCIIERFISIINDKTNS